MRNIIISLQHQPRQRPLRPRPRPWTSLTQPLQPLPQQQRVQMRHHLWCCIPGIYLVRDPELFSGAWVQYWGFFMNIEAKLSELCGTQHHDATVRHMSSIQTSEKHRPLKGP